jgi:hypothetical protein
MGMDSLLLGLVDRLGALRGDLYRPYLQGADDPAVCYRRAADSDRLSMVWFSIFGGPLSTIEHFGAGGIADAVQVSNAAGFFAMLQHFPAPMVLIGLATMVR